MRRRQGIAAAFAAMALTTALMAQTARAEYTGPVTCRVLVDSFLEAEQELDRQAERELEEQIKDEAAEWEKELLAQLVAAEAEGEELLGKRYIIDVVMNRVEDPDFPDTIRGVIYQPGQFSCIDNGRFERAAWEVSESDFEAVRTGLKSRINRQVLFFTAGNYGKYGTPAFKCGSHYFSKK
jgi:N-acetylmuramoyl-L-alanine amidase